MSLLDFFIPSKSRDPRPASDLRLAGPRVVLRMGAPPDWQAWRELRGLSRDFLKPWEPEWPKDALSCPFFDSMLRRHLREWREGTGYGFFIFVGGGSSKGQPSFPLQAGIHRERPRAKESLGPPPRADGSPLKAGMTLIGGISLNDVRRGIAQKATLGYWIGEPYAQHGYMTEAAGLVCDFAFCALKLHRVEASCVPANEPSKKLLNRLGFAEEGYAKSYLRIDGEWQDHVLWGKSGA